MKYRVRLKTREKEIIYVICTFAIGVFFFFLLGEGGTIIEKDSYTYISWSYLPYRKGYTLYPWFLKLIRFIHGEEKYIIYIYIYQGLLSIVSNLLLIEYIRKRYNISYFVSIIMHILILATYSYTLPYAVSSHYLMTEGISFPLFIVSVFFFLRCIIEHSSSCFYGTVLMCVLIFLTRPHMIVFIFIYVVSAIVFIVFQKIEKEKHYMLFSILVFVAIFMSMIGVYGYFRMISRWNNSMNNSQLLQATSGKALCLLKEEDAKYYSGETLEIYRELYYDCKRNGRLISDFPKSVLDYETVHRIVNKNITSHEDVIRFFFSQKRGDDGGIEVFKERNQIISTEIMNNKKEYIGIILRLLPSSLVASIFIQPFKYRFFCYIFATIMYIASLLLLLYSIKKQIDIEYSFPLSVIMGCIIANAVFCNVLLYGQQRYVVYCIGLFYIFNLVLIKEIISNRHQKYTINPD